MRKVKNSRVKNRKTLLVALLCIVVLLAVGYYFLVAKDDSQHNDNPQAGETKTINLDPPTQAEVSETERFKQGLTNKSQDNQPNQAPTVTPIIGYLQQAGDGSIESNAYIPGVTEINSTCTLVLEKDGVKVTESRQTIMDAQGIICGRIAITKDKLTAGYWKAYISFDSSSQKGKSEERKIEVR